MIKAHIQEASNIRDDKDDLCVTICDINPSMINVGKARVKELGLNKC